MFAHPLVNGSHLLRKHHILLVLTACAFLLTSVGIPPASAVGEQQQARIVGGEDVPDNAYPFMASLSRQGKHFCGGTLVDRDIVMTAAHCITKIQSSTGLPSFDANGVTVTIGRTVRSDTQQGVERKITNRDIFVQTRYMNGEFSYDMALILFDQPVPGITPVKLVERGVQDPWEPGQQATALGWGNSGTTTGNHFSDRLRQAEVTILSHDRCSTLYPEYKDNVNLCAGTQQKTACLGDDGGPLLQNVPGQEHDIQQIGLISHRTAICGIQGAPVIHVALNAPGLVGLVKPS